jgi:hypothetical protein
MMRLLCVLGATLGLLACDDASDPPPPDRGVIDQGPAEPMCFMNPMAHLEIINACTAATSIKKVAVTPLRNADGSLPPLP